MQTCIITQDIKVYAVKVVDRLTLDKKGVYQEQLNFLKQQFESNYI